MSRSGCGSPAYARSATVEPHSVCVRSVVVLARVRQVPGVAEPTLINTLFSAIYITFLASLGSPLMNSWLATSATSDDSQLVVPSAVVLTKGMICTSSRPAMGSEDNKGRWVTAG